MGAEENNKKLGFGTLVAIASASAIAGVISTISLATGQTGRSAWMAYATAVLIGGVLRSLPAIFFTSMFRFKGGNYTLVTKTMGDLAGGIYSLWWLPMFFGRGVAASALGEYMHSVFPAISAVWASVLFTTLMFAVNLFGVRAMARLQNPFMAVSSIVLIVFVVIGLTQLQPDTMNITSPEYYLNGGMGFLSAVVLVLQPTSGPSLICGFSWEAENPKRNIPLAILATSGVVLLIYVGVSLVASNSLPISDVAGRPLTYVAQGILPTAITVIFLLLGPVLILCSSLNSTMASFAAPVLGAIRHGWFPAFIGKTNRHGSPWVIYTVMWLVCVIPLIIGVSTRTFTAYAVMTQRICGILLILSAFCFPKRFPQQWKASFLHMPDAAYYVLFIFVALLEVATLIMSIISLSLPVFVGNLALVLILAAYACNRYRHGKICVSIVIDDEE